MAGRKQRGRGGGRGYHGGRGFGRGRGGRGGGGRGRGRGHGLGYMMHEIDDDFVVEPVPFRTSGPPSWRMSFMVGPLQTPGVTHGATRRLLTQEDTTAREMDEGWALIMTSTTRTAWTTATTTTLGTRLP